MEGNEIKLMFRQFYLLPFDCGIEFEFFIDEIKIIIRLVYKRSVKYFMRVK